MADMIMSPAEDSSSRTSLAKTVVVRRKVLGVPVAEKDKSLDIRAAISLQRALRPSVTRQRLGGEGTAVGL